MRIDNPYSYRNYLGRCTSRDENGNAEIEGLDMTFLLGLHYEEQKLVQQALNRLADFEDAEEAADMNDNPPLTWDELVRMTGKPVWMGIGSSKPRWRLIESTDIDEIVVSDCFCVRVPVCRKDLGTFWTAYRKERTE